MENTEKKIVWWLELIRVIVAAIAGALGYTVAG